jgi:hypothetical protein
MCLTDDTGSKRSCRDRFQYPVVAEIEVYCVELQGLRYPPPTSRIKASYAEIEVYCAELQGLSFKWMLQQVVGHFLAMLIVSFLDILFLMSWLVFYFSERSKENQGQTQQFSLRNLEEFLDRLRMKKIIAGFNGWHSVSSHWICCAAIST